MSIYVSELHSPFENLAFENALLKRITAPTLFLYENESAVVIGRAQNPWVEANLPWMHAKNIPLVRRQSGGGCVVHGKGNLNFSFIMPRKDYDKTAHLHCIMRALHSLDLAVVANERHDLLLTSPTDGRLKKISGSAFRETCQNAFHHGTLLINADLDRLRQALQAPPRAITTQAIASHKSPVMNLRELKPNLTVAHVSAALTQAFKEQYGAETLVQVGNTALNEPEIQHDIALYQSSTWCYDRSLPFSETFVINNQTVHLQVEQGKFVHWEPHHPTLSSLLGQRYAAYTQPDLVALLEAALVHEPPATTIL